MIKKFLGISTAAFVLAFAVSAFASAELTHLTLDGGTNVTVDEGDSIEAEVTFDVDSSTDVDSLSWVFVGSGLPKKCEDVKDSIADGTFSREFDIDTKGTTQGTWDVKIVLYGVDDSGVENQCDPDDDIDDFTFYDRVTVEDEDSIGGPNESSQMDILMASIRALIESVKQVIAKPFPSPTPSPTNVKCSTIAPYKSAPANTYSAAGVQLQSALLLDNPYSIPALKPGSTVPMGFRGPQTESALMAYNAMYGCY